MRFLIYGCKQRALINSLRTQSTYPRASLMGSTAHVTSIDFPVAFSFENCAHVNTTYLVLQVWDATFATCLFITQPDMQHDATNIDGNYFQGACICSAEGMTHLCCGSSTGEVHVYTVSSNLSFKEVSECHQGALTRACCRCWCYVSIFYFIDCQPDWRHQYCSTAQMGHTYLHL